MTDRLRRSVGHDHPGVVGPGEGGEVQTVGPADAADDDLLVQRGQLTNRPDADVVQPLRRRRTDTPERLDGQRVEERQLVVRPDDDDARPRPPAGTVGRRLRRPRRQLGDHLRPADADGAVERQPVADALADLVGNRLRRAEQPPRPGHVEERLVEADRFDERRHRQQDVAEHLAHRRVAGVVTVDEDRVRAELPGPQRRHRRVDAERPGLVRARRDDAAGPAPADDHRLAGQRRVVENLDRREEAVHVDVKDRRDDLPAAGARLVSHRAAGGGTPRRRGRRPAGPPLRPDGGPPRRPTRRRPRTGCDGTRRPPP